MRLIMYGIVFIVGGAVGMAWGVHHPVAAQRDTLKLQAEVSKAKLEILQKFRGSDPSVPKMIDDEQRKLNDTQHQLDAQGQ